MNRRGFISLLAGAAGAPLVPWRGLSEPRIFLPPRAEVLIHAGNWTPPVGHLVQCLADFHDPLAPPEYESTKWALAEAIYFGENFTRGPQSHRGWYFMGGEWMTERDRQDFVEAIEGRNARLTVVEEPMPPAAINLVRLHRRRA